MTIDEAIKLCEEGSKSTWNGRQTTSGKSWQQMAEWLKDYKRLLEQEPCDDAISKQAVLKLQYRIDDSATLSTRDVINVEDIEALPPVTPQPKMGRWIKDKCSICGEERAWYGQNPPYCPDCGHKMQEVEE